MQTYSCANFEETPRQDGWRFSLSGNRNLRWPSCWLSGTRSAHFSVPWMLFNWQWRWNCIPPEPASVLRAALHEHDQYADNGHEGEQQPHPLPNGARMFYGPAFRGNILSLCKLGGSGGNEAAFPALNAANGNPELVAHCFNGFPVQQAQHGIGLFMARDPHVPMNLPRFGRRIRRRNRVLARFHAFLQENQERQPLHIIR
jgi:hypothetical protein